MFTSNLNSQTTWLKVKLVNLHARLNGDFACKLREEEQLFP